MPTSKILAWTRAGLLLPKKLSSGAYLFSFHDIALLRTARGLLDEDVSPRTLMRALSSLRDQLPGRPLSALDLSAAGDRILVRDEGTVWEPDSGQINLEFPEAEPEEPATTVASRRISLVEYDGELNADDWYNTGVDLEAVAIQDAIDAYGRALELEPEHADALLNLGRLLHEVGDLEGAERRYRAAIFADPFSARALFNLGVLFEDRHEHDEAVSAYREALRIDRDLASAHFNLARLHRASRRREEALKHIKEYERIVARRDER